MGVTQLFALDRKRIMVTGAERGVVAYTASKHGVLGLIRTLSQEWAPLGIRENGIGTSYIRTQHTEALFADEEHTESQLRRIPMGRFGEPGDLGDLAEVAVFLASDASAHMTGQLLMVDEGWTAS
jgi:NAD(P)-dependent dehydrogenase (short-subunit alcohol dehydrogenase family)